MIAVHQCARVCEKPKLSHEKVFKRIVKYLLGTRHIGMHANINLELGLIAFVDSDFANGWNELNTDDASSLFSRSGYSVHCMGMPIFWCIKLKYRIALSSTEVEHATLSTFLRDVMPIMNIITEISTHVQIKSMKPTIKCKLFEDN